MQVADRWHLLKNMTETIEKVLNRKRQLLKEAAASIVDVGEEKSKSGSDGQEPPNSPSVVVETEPVEPLMECKKPVSRGQQDCENRRNARLELYNRVVELSQSGASIRFIARQLGIMRATVKKYLAAGAFPEMAPRIRMSRLDSYLPFIQKRLADPEVTGAMLHRELQQQGYSGSECAVRRYLRIHRNSLRATKRKAPQLKKTFTSPRSAAALIAMQEHKREPSDKEFLKVLRSMCPELDTAMRLACAFATMIRERTAAKFDLWRAEVQEAAIPEITGFTEFLNRDRNAILAAMSVKWSNGATEGHVNRLKTIKRQMYGRAGFEMLRKRVLIPP
jgi:transposase